jgi:hypothetical protein
MQSEYSIDCPYCGETFVTLLDTSIDQQEYIEDCQICCNPIVFEVRVDTISGEFNVVTRRDNE